MAKTEPTHTITLFKNDGSSSYIYMDTDVLPSITSLTNWSREGYDFVEWNSKADGSGISYAPGYTIVTLDENELNFYTIWKCSVISKVKLPDGSLKYISTDWENITNKPTTLAGCGITDAKIQNGIITLGNNIITPLTEQQGITTVSSLKVNNNINQLITGTSVRASEDKGSNNTPRYIPGKWLFETGVDPIDGATYTIKIPSAGTSAGIYMSVNGTTDNDYYPIVTSGTTRLQNQYGENTTLQVIFESAGSAVIYNINPSTNSTETITGGVFRVVNYYDSNTNTQMRTYRESTNGEYPVLSSRTKTSSITSGSYVSVYGIITSDDSKDPTINPSTGRLTVPGGITGDLTGTASKATADVSGNTFTTTYAKLASPALTGTPTAPTATFGTNTTQIATTAFVQQAIRPTIMVTVSDMPSNANVSVTASLIGSDPLYSVTETLTSAGVASLGLDYLGEYSITFNNPQAKGNPTINATIPKVYTYGAYWSEIVTYTLNIDKTNSNSATACTYADDALGMTKGASSWDNMPIFKQIKPCIFQSGQVNYYLNPNNWNQKADGTDADLTGEDGDVMIEFPKFAYKIKTSNNTITISVSTDPAIIENDSDYTYDAFSRLEEGDLNYFYKGAFKGSLDEEGKLRSIVGTKPANNKNIGAFRTAAQANGVHYQQSTYAQLKAIQCLYLIKYGDRNGQTTVGKGVVGASASYVSGYNTMNVEDVETATDTLVSGMTFGTTANGTTHMRLFGIEDFWGNIWEWVDGLTADGSRNLITSWNSFSNEGVTATTVSTPSGLTANANGWINDVAGNTAAGFMPVLFGNQNGINASSSGPWADSGSLFASCVLRFGGAWNDGDNAGPFLLRAHNNASYASAAIGARLSYV